MAAKNGTSPNHAIKEKSKPGALSDKNNPDNSTKMLLSNGFNDTVSIILNIVKSQVGADYMSAQVNQIRMKKNILGIDPGSTKIGYGVISYENRSLKPKVVGYGYIDLSSSSKESQRLLQLYSDLKEIFQKYKPAVIAIENLYFFKNAKTIIPVLQARGVILFTAAEASINVSEYTPLQIKQTISGYGKADKKLIQKLVKSNLDICTNIKPDDASDALAIALCYFRHLT